MASDKSDHDLLIEIHTKLEALEKSWDKVSNGMGFSRCVTRGETLKQLEKELVELQVIQKAAAEASRQDLRRIYKYMIVVFIALGGVQTTTNWEGVVKLLKLVLG